MLSISCSSGWEGFINAKHDKNKATRNPANSEKSSAAQAMPAEGQTVIMLYNRELGGEGKEAVC